MKTILTEEERNIYDHGSLVNSDINGSRPKIVYPIANNNNMKHSHQVLDDFGHFIHPYIKLENDELNNYIKHHPDTQNNLFGSWKKECENNPMFTKKNNEWSTTFQKKRNNSNNIFSNNISVYVQKFRNDTEESHNILLFNQVIVGF